MDRSKKTEIASLIQNKVSSAYPRNTVWDSKSLSWVRKVVYDTQLKMQGESVRLGDLCDEDDDWQHIANIVVSTLRNGPGHDVEVEIEL